MIKVIVDSGSTKAHWILKKSDQIIAEIKTMGLNPHIIDKSKFLEVLTGSELVNHKDELVNIYFYGAGCSDEYYNQLVSNWLKEFFLNCQQVVVANDIIGACIALFGQTDGIACILGTGANSCVYIDQKIVANIAAPGFILGDEGSGSFFGKILLKLFLYNRLPKEMMEHLSTQYNLSESVIYQNVYSSDMPNRYLASFFPVIVKYREHQFIQDIISSAFDKFIKYHILDYKEYLHLPIGVVGSITHILDKEWEHALNKYHLTNFKTIKEPILGLSSCY